MLVNSAFAGISQAIALAHAPRVDDDRRRELHQPAAALPLDDVPRAVADAALDAGRGSRFNPVNWGVNAARAVVLPATDWGAVGVYLAAAARAHRGDRRPRDLGLPLVPEHAVEPR